MDTSEAVLWIKAPRMEKNGRVKASANGKATSAKKKEARGKKKAVRVAASPKKKSAVKASPPQKTSPKGKKAKGKK
jgi:hypothetical protein